MNETRFFKREEIDDKITIFIDEQDDFITAFWIYDDAIGRSGSQAGTDIFRGSKADFPWDEGEEKSRDNLEKKLAQMASKMRQSLK